ncbi:ABC-type nitrate/sulfonate/bicarbonate transport system, permease component [Caballeronia glathei]|uniref:Nitrate ABC transporter permease n=1 Tax=Caballeronia glathei TaxID=60547 RepID=A0A069PJR5_9BURK|nr:ABC transporter permease subunit [Caballeronia glathei]KDR40968.1 nitrate ABC transporter permease [Caballeronia glathei]CDY73607.1 ABC-type nitrate/sulfonate/bicarbonate transport system, permease component [Caballeronia glathei]
MSTAARWRVGLVVALLVVLEVASRAAWINPVSFIPPSKMIASAWDLLVSGQYANDIALTLSSALCAVALAVVAGFAGGVLLFRLPRVRRVLDPLLLSYYAVPVFVLYPILIVILGLNRWPLVAIGFLFAVVAMAVNTLNGLERVPRVLLRTARVCRLRTLDEIRLITLPASLPFVFTGIKLTVVYAFIAVVAGEFVLSGSGFGYQIAFAYNNFDNPTMYGLMVLMLVFVGTVNALLRAAEARLYRRIRREGAA